MNASPVTLAASAPAAYPVVLQPRLLDQSQRLTFQAALHQALQSASTVMVDFIWLEAIDPAVVAVLKQAVQLAARLGKSIAFRNANATLLRLLEQEQDRLRAEHLGDWQQQCDREFEHFLRNRHAWHNEAATVPDGAIVFPKFARMPQSA